MCITSQEKQRLQEQATEATSEEEIQQLQTDIANIEFSLQGRNVKIEQHQKPIKMWEESLHQLEKEEEEGVLY